MDFPILSAIIAVPIGGAVVALFIPAERPEISKAVGYAVTMITFGFAAWMLWNFDPHAASFQFVQNRSWIPTLGVRYIVGVDGINLFMVVVTALLFPLGLLASERYITHRVKAYVAWFLLLEGAIMGIFLSLDLILFFVFWELMLVPMYFLIQGWGSEHREFAAMKFFLYTAFGSAFLLASILALGFLHESATGHLTFDFRVLAAWNGLSGTTEVLLFLGFMIAFAIKAPLFPFHTWLPLVHTEAPTAGSVVLAGVILKMGAYGLLRFSFELFPQASVDLAPLLLVLAIIGIIYGAIVATMQTDLKRVIAYSSVAHMGFVVLGIFSLTVIGIDGAVFTMLSHPLTTGALFLVVGMLYERRHTREISAYRGVWKSAPVLSGFFLAALFAGIGLPGFSGFIGEFLSLLGTFVYDRPYAIVATLGVILAAVYSLWAFQRAFTGKPRGENAKLRDVSLREVIVVAPLIALSLFLGLYPKPALDRIEPSVRRAVSDLEKKSDYREPHPPGIAKVLQSGDGK
ncbi:MAG TPA: NADH-quinone oxidoreductase subunit M [Acidimicrobiia bacterium]|nr:NADH-quinone oxidoreductase subunit M [Acidimicrobiia bacterium]